MESLTTEGMKMEKSTCEQFKNYIKSYSGIDGGNRKSRIWFCGIEYGGATEELDGNRCAYTLAQVKGWDDDFKNQNVWKNDRRKWTFNRTIAKIMATMIYGAKAANTKECWETYYDKQLFAPCGNEFKLNLFPLAFRNTSEWVKSSCFQKKDQYYDFCRQDRFGLLRKLKSDLNPKIVICFGLCCKSDFEKAFGFSESLESHFCVAKNERRRYFHSVEGDSVLLVLPFPNRRFGLNSWEAVEKASELILDLGKLDRGDLHT